MIYMKKSQKIRVLMCLFTLIPWVGCMVKAPPPKPVVVIPPPTAHIVGVWDNQARDGSVHKMIFEPNGKLTFQGD